MVGVPIDPEKEILHSIILTPKPTPVTGHMHLIVIVQNKETGRLKLYSIIAHPEDSIKQSITEMSESEYVNFIEDWIKVAPYEYTVTEVNTSDPNEISKLLRNRFSSLRVKRTNPFIRGYMDGWDNRTE